MRKLKHRRKLATVVLLFALMSVAANWGGCGGGSGGPGCSACSGGPQ